MFEPDLLAPRISEHEGHIDVHSNFLKNYIQVSIH
jgi:hypothetical protein